MRDSDYSKKARSALLVKKSELKTWRAVAQALGFNAGYLLRVANGARHPSNRLLIALGLPPRAVTIEPLACGHAPLAKRCPVCNQKHAHRRRRRAAVGIW
jgi:hypothetical protein